MLSPSRLSRLELVTIAVGVALVLVLPSSLLLAAPGAAGTGFADRYADVNGVRLHYMIGGQGPAVVLLHGYAQTSQMWRPVMPLLAERHTVIVPDLRGAGDSEKPEAGYDKKNMAVDIHELMRSLGFDRVSIVGHDIGLMVAYAYAASFPQSTERLVMMDAFLPGIGNWKDVWLMRDLWHFHFYGEVPLALVKGRERTYFEHFWNDFAADPKRSVSEADRQLYAAAYAQPGGMRAGFEYFRNFERDADDFARLGATRLAMPVLVLTGEKASGQFLIDQARLVATDVKGVIVEGSGHWLIDEAPAKVIPQLADFLGESRPAAGSHQRLTPAEIGAQAQVGPGAGTSGVSGIQTRVLNGDPTRPGLYTIQLSVPSNTHIEAHGHPDDRVATVVSGTWYFGYGPRFDDKELKALPPGSFYTEPANEPHFARAGRQPVVVQISGVGPTGTSYVEGQGPPSAKR
jgi:pimeloyl-ACP methyl ester carboxylesterase/quercetin dioxygenase-like cupin family protein